MAKFDGIRITDSFSAQVQVAPNRKNTFESNDAIDDSGSLIVKIPMTHAGIVTRNAGFYQPNMMRLGGKSFTDGFEKPVQIGHGSKGLFSSSDSEPEVIGRVKQANFVDTSEELLKKDKKLQKLFQQHLSKDKEEATEAAIEMARHIDKKYMKDGLPKGSFEGLGYLEGVLSIPDRDAAQKIIDGRYNTVSISVASNAAFCTTCGQNLVEDGPCEHRRGEEVDGHRSLIILDELRYAHVAIVNEPADPLAANFELFNSEDSVSVEGNDHLSQDNLEVAAKCFLFYNLDNIQPLEVEKDVNLVQIGDAIGGITSAMSKKKKNQQEDNVDPEVTANQQDDGTPAADPTAQDDGVTNDDNPTEQNDQTGNPDGGTETDPAEEAGDQVDPFVALLKDKLELPEKDLPFVEDFFAGQECVEDKADEYLTQFKEHYDSMIEYSDATGEDSYSHMAEFLEDDAKLSEDALKEAAKTSFCGPKRSFPVTDAAHVEAAKKLLAKTKTSSLIKKRIANAIDRRAKALGYEAPEVENIDNNNNACDNTTVIQDFSALEDKDLTTWFDKVKEELETRKMFDSLVGVQDLKEQIEVLDSQLESAYDELDSYSDREVSYEDSYKDLLAQRLLDYKVLSGETIEDNEVALTEYKGRSIESLEDSIKDLAKSVDMNSIAQQVNNGITNEPTGTVDNPVLQDSGKENTAPSQSSKQSNETSAIYSAYDNMLKTYGKAAADNYIENQRKLGKLPKVTV